MEAAMVVATIAQRFQLRSVPDHPVIPVPSFTLRPKHGIRMTIERRQVSSNINQQLQAMAESARQ
jgi:cytochrome P450